DLESLGLPVWPVLTRCGRMLVLRSFVPVEAEPAEVAQDRVLGATHVALHVRILDPQHERAAMMAREEPVEYGESCVADVEAAGGAGREARAYDRAHRVISSGA